MASFKISSFLLIVFFILAAPATAQDITGVQATCPDGGVIENGVEIVLNMRSGYTYTATAVGLNGFDPVLAVADQGNVVMCSDDSDNAATYSANLPTTGQVNPSNLSAQIDFWHDYQSFADVSVIIGGYGNTSGEFLLILEGMSVTSADGSGASAGDPITVYMTPNVTASGVPVTIYMISVTTALDPLLKVMDDYDQIIQFEDGSYFACDDAGNYELCWGQSVVLSDYYVPRSENRRLPGGTLDAMMSVPIELMGLGPQDTGFMRWRMSSTRNSYGDYVAALHMGTSSTILEPQKPAEPPQQPIAPLPTVAMPTAAPTFAPLATVAPGSDSAPVDDTTKSSTDESSTQPTPVPSNDSEGGTLADRLKNQSGD